MTEVFAEYRDAGSTGPLRQGDVIEAVQPGTKWNRLLLVITADCDFAFDKHQGRVTCVPLLSQQDYLLELHLPRLRMRHSVKPIRELQAIVHQATGATVTDERMLEWCNEVTPDQLLSELSLDEIKAAHGRLAIESIQLLSKTVETVPEALEMIVASQLSSSNPPSISNARRAARDSIRAIYTSTPGDAMFLSAVGPSYDQGYFAYLRHLEQVWEPQVGTGPTRRQLSHRRVARLQDRYLHALVQRFAMVFMAIGLPSEYESMRDLHADLIGTA